MSKGASRPVRKEAGRSTASHRAKSKKAKHTSALNKRAHKLTGNFKVRKKRKSITKKQRYRSGISAPECRPNQRSDQTATVCIRPDIYVAPKVPRMENVEQLPAVERSGSLPSFSKRTAKIARGTAKRHFPKRIQAQEKRTLPTGERPTNADKFRTFCEINVNAIAQREVELSEEKRRLEIEYVFTSWMVPWELVNRLSRHIQTPVVAFTALALLVASVAVVWHATRSPAHHAEALAEGTRYITETNERSARIENDRLNRLAFVESAYQTVSDYAAAQSWEEALPAVLEPERVRSMMQDYYEKRPDAFPFSPDGLSGEYRELEVPLQSGSNQVAIFRGKWGGAAAGITVVATDHGALIDWEATVGYNPTELGELANEPADAPVRVIARVGDLYHSPHLQESSYLCVELSHPDEPGVLLFGYAEKYSAVERALQRLLPSRDSAIPRGLGFAPGVELNVTPGTGDLGFSEFAGITVELEPFSGDLDMPSTFFEITRLDNPRWIR